MIHLDTRGRTSAPGSGAVVAIFSQCYWPEAAGSGPPVQQLAETIARAGCSVEVLTVRPFYPHRTVLPEYRDGGRDREVHNGVAILRGAVPPFRSGSLLSRLMTETAFAVFVLLRAPRARRAQTAIAVCPSILTVAAMIAVTPKHRRRVAIVHDVQSGLADSLKITNLTWVTETLRRIERVTLNRVDEIITLSPAMADALRALGVRRPIRLIPPTVDDERIRPRPEPDALITIVYSGNIGRKQGLDQIVDMAAILRDRAVKARIVIRGDGNHRDDLDHKVTERKLGDYIRLEPFWPTETLSEGLASGHIHLVPQDPAGAAYAVPSKIYSIMAAGRPLVCTAEPGSPMDMIAAESGAVVICPPNDPDRMADGVEALCRDPAKRARLGRNGRAYVEAHAGKAACRDAYLSIISGRSGGPGG